MRVAITRQLQSARKHLNVLSSSSALKGPTQYIKLKKNTLENLEGRLFHAQKQKLNRKRQNFISLTAKLDAMSPLKVLTRGYSMAETEDGQIIRSVSQVGQGSTVDVIVSDGTFRATVTDIKERKV